jgi:molybdenum cofactor cytidylyltransferase/nicotine blue oxidoreductase
VTEDACCEPGDCKTGRLRIGAVLLAAGEGARLGGRAKGAIEIEGEPLLLRGLRILSEVGVDEVVVVTGHYQSELAPLLTQAHSLFNDGCLVEVTQPMADHSQSDSLQLGVASLSSKVDAAMVLPVDMPALTPADLVALIGAYKHADAEIEFVGPRVGARPGNPVLFSQRIALQIAQGQGDFGSGAWRHQRPDWLLEWQTDSLHYVTDIDTLEDLDRWT